MNFIIKFEAEMGPGFKWLEVGPTKEAFTTFVIYNKEMMAKQNPQANVGHPNIILSTTNIEATYSKMKENNEIKQFRMIFVVYSENYKDMPKFVKLAKKYNATAEFWALRKTENT